MSDPVFKVYFLHDPPEGIIKIGWSQDLQSRWKSLQWEVGRPLALLGWIPSKGVESMELRWHLRFLKDRVRGEWFRDTLELRAEIDRCKYVLNACPSGDLLDDTGEGGGYLTLSRVCQVAGKSHEIVAGWVKSGQLQSLILKTPGGLGQRTLVHRAALAPFLVRQRWIDQEKAKILRLHWKARGAALQALREGTWSGQLQ